MLGVPQSLHWTLPDSPAQSWANVVPSLAHELQILSTNFTFSRTRIKAIVTAIGYCASKHEKT
jgi:hypothetical protein